MSQSMRRRTFLGLAAAAGLSLTPSASAFARQATPSAELRLMPLPPEELGAPAVPAAAVSTAANPTPYDVAVAPYAGFGTDAGPGVFPRTITHAMGTTTLETAPTRIITLDVGELDSMLLMGIKPVGAVAYTGTPWPPFIQDQSDGITVVGTLDEPDLEQIVGLQPDLIISSKLRHEQLYDRLSQIAPTVFSERPGVSFQHNFAFYAQASGREVEAAAVVARYEERVRALNAALPTPRPITAVVQLRTDEVRFYQRANFIGVMLADLGFPRSEAENVDDFAAFVSQEQIGQLADAELLILAVQEGDNPYAEEILAGPLWQSLPAVQSNNLFTVDNSIWIAGVGYGSSFEVLDDIAEYFGITA